MKKLTLELPEDLALILNESWDQLAQEIRVMSAIKLYELGKLSLGKAAELAGMQKVDFMFLLSKYGVPVIDYSEETLEHEARTIRELTDEL